MAVVTITEYASLASDGGGTLLPLVQEPPAVTQSAKTSIASSTQSSAFGSSTKFVMLTTDTACHYLVDTNPTATTSCNRLPANQMVLLAVRKGLKVAVIAAA